MPSKDAPATDAMFKEVGRWNVGYTFHHSALHPSLIEVGCGTNNSGPLLSALTKLGVISKISRGVWQKVREIEAKDREKFRSVYTHDWKRRKKERTMPVSKSSELVHLSVVVRETMVDVITKACEGEFFNMEVTPIKLPGNGVSGVPRRSKSRRGRHHSKVRKGVVTVAIFTAINSMKVGQSEPVTYFEKAAMEAGGSSRSAGPILSQLARTGLVENSAVGEYTKLRNVEKSDRKRLADLRAEIRNAHK